MLLAALLIALSLVLLCSFADQRARPFAPRDLWRMKRVGSPTTSPDGAWIVYTLRSFDLEQNKGTTQLWLTAPDGAARRQLTTHPAGASDPAWSSDGAFVYFLSGRSDSQQVWRIRADGGEAEQVTDFQLDVVGYKLTPDPQLLVLAFDVFPDDPTLAATRERLDYESDRKQTGRLYERLFVRHWDHWKDGRRHQLFSWRIGSETPPQHLLRDLPADVPSKPFGGMEETAVTPDGRAVVFSAGDDFEREAWSTRHNLYVVPLDGSASPRKLTTDNEGWLTDPQFSPNGKMLAWVRMARPGFESDRRELVLKPWPDGEPRVLTADWDRSIAGFCWSRDGEKLYAHADDLGRHPLFEIDVARGGVASVCGGGHCGDPNAVDSQVVFTRHDLHAPAELYVLDRASGETKQLTDHNEAVLAELELGETEQFSFAGWNDETVHGWLIKPVNYDPAKKYPLAFIIHGGPQGSFHDQFHYRWNPQVYAGAGYAAVMIDFHGSTGYGQAFTDAISHHWHDRPFEDLQKGLAAVLEQNAWIDGERVAALGASYGGYMVNWIAGAWPDRFRCLVNHDGLFSLRMGYYDTEELWFAEWEHGVEWESRATYDPQDPMNFVDKWKTPMLVIHGGRDYRLAETHGLATFTALQRRGIPSQFLHFPDENHWVLKPANSVQWHSTVLAWLDRWTKD